MAATIEQPVVTRPRRVVEISPNTDLHFYPPEGGSRDSVAVLTLRNISDGFTLFKIKTTAPKRYCVRPNCGRIATGDTATVQVLLQPPFPPTLGENEKPHKFLVQTMPIPADADATTPAQALWKSLERRDNIVEQRLKCHWYFDLPPKSAVTADLQPEFTAVASDPTVAAPVASPAPTASPAAAVTTVSPIAAAAIAKSVAPAAPAAAPAASPTPAVKVSNSSPPARPASPPKQSPAAVAASPASKPETSSQLRRRIKPDSSAGAVATAGSATATKPAPTATAEHQPILIIIVFLLGVLFGKFVL
eukprot:m.483677 g.483677  ORF g.483677 m.483677 type:complete len:305 (-) comp23042_c0_seq1:93-1007(-)